MLKFTLDMFGKCFMNLRDHGKSITLRRLGVSTSAMFMFVVLGTTKIREFNNHFTKS